MLQSSKKSRKDVRLGCSTCLATCNFQSWLEFNYGQLKIYLVCIDNFFQTYEYERFNKQDCIAVFIDVVSLFGFGNVTNRQEEISGKNLNQRFFNIIIVAN